jgi:putative protease
MVKKKKVAKKTGRGKRVKRPIKARSAKKGGSKKATKAKKVVVKRLDRARRDLALPKKPTEKVLGMVDHYFGKIAVAAIKLKATIHVGDVIRIKGHTTDFVQKIDSIQIEHQSVPSAAKGDDIGIKVKGHVREHDVVYFAAEQTVAPAAQPKAAPTASSSQSYGQTKFMQF